MNAKLSFLIVSLLYIYITYSPRIFKLFTLLAYTGFLCKGYLCTTFRLLVIITRNSYYS